MGSRSSCLGEYHFSRPFYFLVLFFSAQALDRTTLLNQGQSIYVRLQTFFLAFSLISSERDLKGAFRTLASSLPVKPIGCSVLSLSFNLLPGT